MVRSNVTTTAAAERSRRSLGYYVVYYGAILPFRPVALKKWMDSVTLCQAMAELQNGIKTDREILSDLRQAGSPGQFNPKGRFMSEGNLADAKKKGESAPQAVECISNIETIRPKRTRPAPSSVNANGTTICIFPSL